MTIKTAHPKRPVAALLGILLTLAFSAPAAAADADGRHYLRVPMATPAQSSTPDPSALPTLELTVPPSPEPDGVEWT